MDASCRLTSAFKHIPHVKTNTFPSMKIATQKHKHPRELYFHVHFEESLKQTPFIKAFSYLPRKHQVNHYGATQDTDPYGYRPSLVPMVPRALDVVSTEGSYWTPSAWHRGEIA